MMRIGEKIKQLRKEMGVTQDQLGKHLNISYQAISKWENGESFPDIALLVSIADYFDITTDELLGGKNTIHRSGYKNRREELLTIYECDGNEDDFKRVIAEYKEILLHGTPSTQDYMNYGYLYDKYSERSVNKAIEYYKKAIEHGNNQRDEYWFQTHQQLTMLLVRNNRGSEAIQNLLSWLEKEPDNIQPYISVAFAYKEVGDYITAYMYIKQAEQLDTNNVTQLTFAGDICKGLRKYEEAMVYWEKAYRVAPEYCSCLYSKAFLIEEVGTKDEAIAAWQTVIDWHLQKGYDIGPELNLPISRIQCLQQLN